MKSECQSVSKSGLTTIGYSELSKSTYQMERELISRRVTSTMEIPQANENINVSIIVNHNQIPPELKS